MRNETRMFLIMRLRDISATVDFLENTLALLRNDIKKMMDGLDKDNT